MSQTNESQEKRIQQLYAEEEASIRTFLVEEGFADKICESPIEKVLAAALWLFNARRGSNYFQGLCFLNWESWNALAHLTFEKFLSEIDGAKHLYVSPQVEIGGYRVDFMFGGKIRGETHLLAVECDGHEYHEKTKEQAMRDKSRDRDLLGRGVPVMRFTGSEIWKDPTACVEQVDLYFFDLAYRKHFPEGDWRSGK